MALLPSEICRLILGFLEEENLLKTRVTFLDECKYLEECRNHLTKGLRFATKIHGKSLQDFLLTGTNQLDDAQKCDKSIQAQPECKQCEDKATITDSNLDDDNAASSKKAATPSKATSNNKSNHQIDDIFCIVNTQNEVKEKLNGSKKRKQFLKMKSNVTNAQAPSLPIINENILMTPTKHNEFSALVTNASSPNNPSDESTSENFLDIESLVENLCQNDFPQKLAESINVLNLKKFNNPNATADDLTTFLTNNLNQSQLNTSSQTTRSNQQSSNHDHQQHQQLVVVESSDSGSFNQLPEHQTSSNIKETTATSHQEQNNEKAKNINIDNQEISLLAEHFSVAAFNAIFDEISFRFDEKEDQLNSENNLAVLASDNLSQIDPKIMTTNENTSPTISDFETKVSSNKSRTSYVIISKRSEDIDRIEKEISSDQFGNEADSRSSNKSFDNYKFLLNACNSDTNKSSPQSTPVKAKSNNTSMNCVTKQSNENAKKATGSKQPRRSKTIKQIFESNTDKEQPVLNSNSATTSPLLSTSINELATALKQINTSTSNVKLMPPGSNRKTVAEITKVASKRKAENEEEDELLQLLNTSSQARPEQSAETRTTPSTKTGGRARRNKFFGNIFNKVDLGEGDELLNGSINDDDSSNDLVDLQAAKYARLNEDKCKKRFKNPN